MHSNEMSNKVLQMFEEYKKLPGEDRRLLIANAFINLGSACVFDDCENEEQVKGAMYILEHFHAFIRGYDGRAQSGN